MDTHPDCTPIKVTTENGPTPHKESPTTQNISTVSLSDDLSIKPSIDKEAAPDSYESEQATHQEFLAKLGKRWVTVEPVVVIYMAAYISLLPMVQQYLYYRLSREFNITGYDTNSSRMQQCRDRANDEESAEKVAFQASLTTWNTLIMVLSVAPALVVMLFAGPISDQKGRKVTLLPALGGGIVVGIGVSFVMWLDLPLELLPSIQFIVGFTGSTSVVTMTSFSYIADINPPEKRLLRILIIEIGMGLGTFVGQIFFGWLIDVTGFVVPAIVFTTIQVFLFLYCLVFLPETVFKNPQTRVFTCETLTRMPRLWFKDDHKGRRKVIWLCVCIMITYGLVSDGINMISTFYLLDPPLCWGATIIGLFNGSTFILKALGGLAFMRLLFGRVPNGILQVIGVVSSGLLALCLGLANETWIPFLGSILGCGSTLVSPVTRSISSAVVPDNQQGALFSGLSWAQMLSVLISSPIANILYAGTATSAHRYIFFGYTAACVIPLTFIMALFFLQTKPATNPDSIDRLTDTIDLDLDSLNDTVPVELGLDEQNAYVS